MSAKDERYNCTLRHARNTSAQAKILEKKTLLSMGMLSVFTLPFLCKLAVAQVQVSVVSDGVL